MPVKHDKILGKVREKDTAPPGPGGAVNSVTGNIVGGTATDPVVTQQQADWNELNNALPSFIQNKPTTLVTIETITATNMAAKILGNNVETKFYKVTELLPDGSSDSFIHVWGIDNQTIQQVGWGQINNALMSAPVAVFMAIDTSFNITFAYDPALKNYIETDVDLFPFDNGNLTNCKFYGIQSIVLDANAVIDRVDARNPSITLDNGSELTNSSLGRDVTVLLGTISTCIWTFGRIGHQAQLVLEDGADFRNCVLGEGKTLNCSITNYAVIGKVYEGNISTFEVSGDDIASINPDLARNIDMLTIQWAGLLFVTDDANKLGTFTNYPVDHSFKVIPVIGETTLLVDDMTVGAGGNIQLEAVGVTLNLNGDEGDWFEFNVHPIDDAIVQKINGRIRV